MIVKELLNPKSIVVVGGSNDIQKPGGKILKNIVDGGFLGKLFVVNPKEDIVQGIKSYRDLTDLPPVELAVLAISSKFALNTVQILTENKKTKAFIIISAGFSEESEQGAELEKSIVNQINILGSLQ